VVGHKGMSLLFSAVLLAIATALALSRAWGRRTPSVAAALGFAGWGPVLMTQDFTKPAALMLLSGTRCGTLTGCEVWRLQDPARQAGKSPCAVQWVCFIWISVYLNVWLKLLFVQNCSV